MRHLPAKLASCNEGSMKSRKGYCLKQLVFLKAKGTEFRIFFLMQFSFQFRHTTHISDPTCSVSHWIRGRGGCLHFKSCDSLI